MVRLGNHWRTTKCHRLQARQEAAERPPLVPDRAVCQAEFCQR
jgi:hypothetical protein